MRYFKPHAEVENFAGHLTTYPVDLNRDGNIDLIGWEEGIVMWWEGDGGGNFEQRDVLVDTERARFLAAADVDSDGDNDLLGFFRNGAFGWWENDGELNFQWHTVDESFYMVAVHVEDLDEDGDFDIIAGLSYADRIRWYENDGNQNFEAHDISGHFSECKDVVCLDLDGDEDKDVIAINSGWLRWWENDGRQNFTEREIDVNHWDGQDRMVVEDLDLDGDPDIIAAAMVRGEDEPPRGRLSWWENDGDGEFEQHIIRRGREYERIPAVADLDFDGDMDIIETSNRGHGNYAINCWENDGHQNFTGRIIARQNISTRYFSITDINGDDDLDIVGVVVPNQGLIWWENCINWRFTEHSVSDEVPGAYYVSCVDLDEDDDQDILGVGYNPGTIYWSENELEHGFTEHLIHEDFHSACWVCSGDLNGNGNQDVLAVKEYDQHVYWWENDDEGEFEEHVIEGQLDGKTSVCAADFDGDNDLDIAATSAWSDFGFDLYGGMTWWENDGEGNFNRHILDENFGGGGHSISATDLDGDGDWDILASARDWGQNPGGMTWWQNDGEGNFERILITRNNPPTIQPCDLDLDGDMDVLGTYAWWENDGDMNFEQRDLPGDEDDFEDLHFVRAADIDLDDDMDIITAGEFGVLWWENDGDQNFTLCDLAVNFWGAKCIQLEDMDNDDDLDIVGASNYFNEVVWWENSIGNGDVPVRFVLNMNRGWSIISTPLIPIDNDIEAMFAPLIQSGNLILLKNYVGRFCFPAEDFNNIPSWNYVEGYHIKLNSPGILRVHGQPVTPDHPIPLPEGWSIAAYFPDVSIEAPVAFAGIEDQLILAKDDQGHFYSPVWEFNNMPPLERGKGYQVKVNADARLVYPNERDGNLLAATDPTPVELIHFNRVTSTGSNMSLLISGDNIVQGSEVGVFSASGMLVGANITTEDGRCGLAVWGDDLVTEEIDGLKEGEAFELRLVDPYSDNENPLFIESILFGKGADYETDALSVIDVSVKPTAPEEFYLACAYPNPFNSVTKISYGLPEKALVSLKVFDTNGRLVTTLLNGKIEAGHHNTVWNGTKITSGIYFIRFKTERETRTSRVVLVK